MDVRDADKKAAIIKTAPAKTVATGDSTPDPPVVAAAGSIPVGLHGDASGDYGDRSCLELENTTPSATVQGRIIFHYILK